MATLLGTFIQGKRLTTRCQFTREGVLTDPTTVACLVQEPTGGLTAYESPDVLREDEGIYTLNFTVDFPGTWGIRWEATGDVQTVDEAVVFCESSVTSGDVPPEVGGAAEVVQDIVGGMVTGGTETGISVTYDDGAGKLNFVAEVTQAELDAAVAGATPSTEAIQDIVGGMVSSNTETGIAVTYDDPGGKLNFVAEVTQAELDTVSASVPTTEAIQDVVGGMVSSNTETGGIDVTYDDPNGKLNFAFTPTAPNVKDYGAIGDGTSHPLSERYGTLGAAQAVYPHAVALTDEIDWVALQKAANLGTATFVPPGVYLVNRTVVLTSGASLWGRHVVGQQFITSGLTCIKQKNAANLDAVVANNEWYNNSATLDEACGLYGLQIDGNKANQTSGLRHGFVNSSWKGWCENVTVINCAAFGLYATGIMKNGTTAHAGGVPEMRFHSCHVRACDGAGIVVEHWSMSDGFITDCIVWECPYGIFLYQSAGWVIHGNHTYGIGYDGITAQNMLYTRISDNYSESFGQSIASGGAEARGIWGRVDVADAIAQVTGNNVHLLLSATGAGSTPVGLRIESSATSGTRAAVAISDNTLRHEHGGTPRAGSIGLKVLKGAGALLVSGLDSVTEIGWATGQSIGSGIVRQGFYTRDFGATMYTDGWFVAREGTAAQVSLGDLGPSGAAGLALGDIGGGTHVIWARGAGSPEGVLTANRGSLYTRTDGGAATTLYVKESGTGNTGWVAK